MGIAGRVKQSVEWYIDVSQTGQDEWKVNVANTLGSIVFVGTAVNAEIALGLGTTAIVATGGPAGVVGGAIVFYEGQKIVLDISTLTAQSTAQEVFQFLNSDTFVDFENYLSTHPIIGPALTQIQQDYRAWLDDQNGAPFNSGFFPNSTDFILESIENVSELFDEYYAIYQNNLAPSFKSFLADLFGETEGDFDNSLILGDQDAFWQTYDFISGSNAGQTIALDNTYHVVVGGSGVDTAHYGNVLGGNGVNVDLVAQETTMAGRIGIKDYLGGAIKDVVGSDYNDTITGNNSANVLEGGLGNDELVGGNGYDRYVFNSGNGRDVVVDDGGVIEIDGNFVYGTAKLSNQAGKYVLQNGNNFYVMERINGGNDLQIAVNDISSNPSDAIILTDWIDGTFGIYLDDLQNFIPSQEFLVNTYTQGYQGSHSIATLADGGFVVTWTSDEQSGGFGDIYGQKYDLVGNKLGSEFLINTYTQYEQKDSSTASLIDGGFVVTWTSYDQHRNSADIHGRRYDSAGGSVGGEFLVNTYTQDYQRASSVTSLADGGFVVTWDSTGLNTPGPNITGQDGSWSGIYGQRYNSAGVSVGGEFQINTYTDNFQRTSSVTLLNDGGFVVTWESSGQDGSYFGVYGQRYDSAGGSIGGEFQINTYTHSQQGNSSVESLADGGFVVTWSSGQDGSGSGIYGQRYDVDGNKAGGEFQINTHTYHNQSASSVSSLADGGFVVILICNQDKYKV